jgi:hypothetical protein
VGAVVGWTATSVGSGAVVGSGAEPPQAPSVRRIRSRRTTATPNHLVENVLVSLICLSPKVFSNYAVDS